MLTQEYLQSLIEYDPDTGICRWKISTNNKIKVGDVVGRNLDKDGYRRITITSKTFMLHRMIFLLMIGRVPQKHIDHVNGDRSDNRWSNLREVDHLTNNRNKRFKNGLMSGIRTTPSNKFVVRVKGGTSRIHIGTFETLNEAIDAKFKALQTHGFHENHGK